MDIQGLCLFQCVQVNINSNLCPKFSGQAPQHFLFIYCLLIGPEVVKPTDNTLLEDLAHTSEVHVVFQNVHTTLKCSSCCIHIGDHGAHITHNGGKDQNAHLQEKIHNEPFD